MISKKNFISLLFLCSVLFIQCTEEKDIIPKLKGAPSGGILKINAGQVLNNQFSFCADLFAVDHFGNFIENLDENCFLYEESGSITIELSSLRTDRNENKGPYSAMLLFDQSGSIEDTDPDDARVDAGKGFVDVMANGDEVAMAVFTSGGSYYTNPYQILNDFTSDQEQLKLLIEDMADKEGGGTPLYRSIYELLEYTSQNAKNQNKAIIVFTDGKDTAGGIDISRLIQDANQFGIEVYTVGLAGLVDEEILLEIALGTGGGVMYASEVDQLISLYKSLGELLRGGGLFYDGCWTATKPSGNWFSGELLRTVITLKLPTGEEIFYPIYVRVP